MLGANKKLGPKAAEEFMLASNRPINDEMYLDGSEVRRPAQPPPPQAAASPLPFYVVLLCFLVFSAS